MKRTEPLGWIGLAVLIAAAIRGHYDAYEVLLQAETYVEGDAMWRLTDDGGFAAVINPGVPS